MNGGELFDLGQRNPTTGGGGIIDWWITDRPPGITTPGFYPEANCGGPWGPGRCNIAISF